MLAKSLRILANVLIALVLMLAVLVGAGRALLPSIDSVADSLQASLSERLGVAITFDQLHGEWRGLSPQLRVHAFQAQHPDAAEPFVVATEITVRWHMLASILSFKPVLDMHLQGAELTLAYEDARWRWQGLPRRDAQPDASADVANPQADWLDTWLTHANLAADDSRIRVTGWWANDVTLDQFALYYRVRYGLARLSGQLRLQGQHEASIRVLANWRGRFADIMSLAGQGYLKIDAANMAEWVPAIWQRHPSLQIQTGSGHLEAWINVHHGQVRRSTTMLNLGQVQLAQEGSTHSAGWQSLQATVHWQSLGREHWLMQVSDLAMVTDDALWLPKRVSVECWQDDEQPERCQAALDRIDLAPWLTLAGVALSSDSRLALTLQDLAPQGQLTDLYAQWQPATGEEPLRYWLTGQLRHYQQQPKHLIPGVDNLAAHFYIHDQGGMVDIPVQAGRLNYPALFRDTLSLPALSGRLRWYRETDQWTLESGRLQVATEQGGGLCQLSLTVPSDPLHSPYLRLQATLSDLDAAQTPHYLPAGILPDGLVRWLDGAVQGGRLLRGDLVFHGPTRWREHPESLQYVLGFQVDQAQFAFLPDWRPVEQAAADVLVQQGNVDVSVLEGHYAGTQVSSGRVIWQRPVAEEATPLQVRVSTVGDLQHAFALLREPPLRDRVGTQLDRLALNGSVKLAVSVDAPLTGEGDVVVAVDATLAEAKLALPDLKLNLSDIQGDVRFSTEHGLSAKELRGRFLGGAVRAAFESQALDGAQTLTIKGNGRLKLPALAKWLDQPWLKTAQGELDYRLSLQLVPEPKRGGDWAGHQLRVTSDLRGVSIDLPSPLGKSADQPRRLQLETRLGKPAQDWWITAEGIGTAALRIVQGVPERGHIALGSEQDIALPDTPGLQISGELAALDLRPWRALGESTSQQAATALDSNQRDGQAAWLNAITQAQVAVAELSWGDYHWGATRLQGSRAADAWQLAVQGDWIDAEAQLPFRLLEHDSYTPDDPFLVLQVRQLDLHLPDTVESVADAVAQPVSSLDPAALPPIDLRLDALHINGKPFGRWYTKLVPTVQGVLVTEADVQFRNVAFRGEGEWLQSAAGVRTAMRGKATADNVRDVLIAWGYEPTLGSESAQLQLQASWPGAPYDFDVLTAQASARGELRNGQFYRISSGAADKVLGALNVDSWLDRLRLQFRDLSSEEMTFSELVGRMSLADGVLGVQQVALESPAMKMALQGDVHLAEDELDLAMAITVPVTRNLVLPAAAVGGLPAAATVFVIERMLGSQLDKLTTMQYQITGPLREPVVTLKESFNIIPKPLQESLATEPRKPEATQPTEADHVSQPAAPESPAGTPTESGGDPAGQ